MNILKKISQSAAVSLGLLAAQTRVASAVNLNDIKNTAQDVGLAGYESFGDILVAILNALLALAFLAGLIFMIISGFRFITSQGNEQQVTEAKKNMLWSIIGIAVIIMSYAILRFVVAIGKSGF